MKHILILFVLLFSVTAHAAEWKPLDYREPGVNIFVDHASVLRNPHSSVLRVWVKEVFVLRVGTDHINYFYGIDCTKYQYQLLVTISYSDAYTHRTPDIRTGIVPFNDIFPDTKEDIVYNYICSK